MTGTPRNPNPGLPHAAIALALLQGLLLWSLFWSVDAERWPGTDPRALLPLTLLALLLPITVHLF